MAKDDIENEERADFLSALSFILKNVNILTNFIKIRQFSLIFVLLIIRSVFHVKYCK